MGFLFLFFTSEGWILSRQFTIFMTVYSEKGGANVTLKEENILCVIPKLKKKALRKKGGERERENLPVVQM